MDNEILKTILIWAIPVLFAITFHELAHGWVADKLGDNTPRMLGRLTLNPIKHVSLLGTVVVPIVLFFFSGFIFGWAKPVPVNTRNLSKPRRDMALVAIAGPLSNLAMALIWGALMKLGFWLGNDVDKVWLPLFLMGQAGVLINVILFVVNIIPVPPLDGGRVLVCVLPGKYSYQLSKVEPYIFIVVAVLAVTGVLWHIIGPPIRILSNLILGLYL
jgi:Zn-dependent protease